MKCETCSGYSILGWSRCANCTLGRAEGRAPKNVDTVGDIPMCDAETIRAQRDRMASAICVMLGIPGCPLVADVMDRFDAYVTSLCGVAQPVEQRPVKSPVDGSSPSSTANGTTEYFVDGRAPSHPVFDATFTERMRCAVLVLSQTNVIHERAAIDIAKEILRGDDK